VVSRGHTGFKVEQGGTLPTYSVYADLRTRGKIWVLLLSREAVFRACITHPTCARCGVGDYPLGNVAGEPMPGYVTRVDTRHTKFPG
jgi:hypothetical protein